VIGTVFEKHLIKSAASSFAYGYIYLAPKSRS